MLAIPKQMIDSHNLEKSYKFYSQPETFRLELYIRNKLYNPCYLEFGKTYECNLLGDTWFMIRINIEAAACQLRDDRGVLVGLGKQAYGEVWEATMVCIEDFLQRKRVEEIQVISDFPHLIWHVKCDI